MDWGLLCLFIIHVSRTYMPRYILIHPLREFRFDRLSNVETISGLIVAKAYEFSLVNLRGQATTCPTGHRL